MFVMSLALKQVIDINSQRFGKVKEESKWYISYHCATFSKVKELQAAPSSPFIIGYFQCALSKLALLSLPSTSPFNTQLRFIAHVGVYLRFQVQFPEFTCCVCACATRVTAGTCPPLPLVPTREIRNPLKKCFSLSIYVYFCFFFGLLLFLFIQKSLH